MGGHREDGARLFSHMVSARPRGNVCVKVGEVAVKSKEKIPDNVGCQTLKHALKTAVRSPSFEIWGLSAQDAKYLGLALALA